MPWWTTHDNAIKAALVLTAREKGDRWYELTPAVGINDGWRVIVRHPNSSQKDYYVHFGANGEVDLRTRGWIRSIVSTWVPKPQEGDIDHEQ